MRSLNRIALLVVAASVAPLVLASQARADMVIDQVKPHFGETIDLGPSDGSFSPNFSSGREITPPSRNLDCRKELWGSRIASEPSSLVLYGIAGSLGWTRWRWRRLGLLSFRPPGFAPPSTVPAIHLPTVQLPCQHDQGLALAVPRGSLGGTCPQPSDAALPTLPQRSVRMIAYLRHPGPPARIFILDLSAVDLSLEARVTRLAADLGSAPEVVAVTAGGFAQWFQVTKRFAHLRRTDGTFDPEPDLLGYLEGLGGGGLAAEERSSEE